MDGPIYILGINSAYHESAACLLRDGELLAAAEEERFTRVKHAKKARVDNPDELPWNAIRYCLTAIHEEPDQRLDLSMISHIGFSLLPAERYDRNIAHSHPYPISDGNFGSVEGEKVFRNRCEKVPAQLRQGGFRGEFHFLDHHVCHAASSFFGTPFSRAAVLVIDGIGEFESTSLYRGEGRSLELIDQFYYPDSLGFLWEKLSAYLGFSEYDAAKVMGLASFGDRLRFGDAFARLIHGGSRFAVRDEIARFRSQDFSALEQLFGLPRKASPIHRITAATQPYADVAAGLQESTERAILALAEEAASQVGTEHLCLSGGVALNCVAIGRLLREGPFPRVFVQPASHDAGTAIGAAYHVCHQVLGAERQEPVLTSYLGPCYTDDEIRAAFQEQGVICCACDNMEEEVAALLAQGNIVAWFQGRLEIGPRALGNRSLLADPRRKDTVDKINRAVKHREPFRPFCPSVLAEEAQAWFDVDLWDGCPAYYMLAAVKARDEKRAQIPAVVHVDGSSRIHAVSAGMNPRFHRLLRAFHNLTRVPMLLNTSFNDQEPIVCSPADALRTFLSTEIDFLAMGDYLISKTDNLVDVTIPDIPLELYFEKLR